MLILFPQYTFFDLNAILYVLLHTYQKTYATIKKDYCFTNRKTIIFFITLFYKSYNVGSPATLPPFHAYLIPVSGDGNGEL